MSPRAPGSAGSFDGALVGYLLVRGAGARCRGSEAWQRLRASRLKRAETRWKRSGALIPTARSRACHLVKHTRFPILFEISNTTVQQLNGCLAPKRRN